MVNTDELLKDSFVQLVIAAIVGAVAARGLEWWWTSFTTGFVASCYRAIPAFIQFLCWFLDLLIYFAIVVVIAALVIVIFGFLRSLNQKWNAAVDYSGKAVKKGYVKFCKWIRSRRFGRPYGADSS